jgi:hypothetical protein
VPLSSYSDNAGAGKEQVGQQAGYGREEEGAGKANQRELLAHDAYFHGQTGNRPQ